MSGSQQSKPRKRYVQKFLWDECSSERAASKAERHRCTGSAQTPGGGKAIDGRCNRL